MKQVDICPSCGSVVEVRDEDGKAVFLPYESDEAIAIKAEVDSLAQYGDRLEHLKAAVVLYHLRQQTLMPSWNHPAHPDGVGFVPRED